MLKGVFGLFFIIFAGLALFSPVPPPALLVSPPSSALVASPERFQGVLKDGASPESILPPEIYMGDAAVLTIYADKPTLEDFCGVGPAACTGWLDDLKVIVMPNPCRVNVSKTERYAAGACHELGHYNGWSGEHGPPL